MGKRQHQKDKMYLTCTEWANTYGGKKNNPGVGETAGFRRLPFHYCSLSLQPFEHPLCTLEGHIFDLMNIVPFLKKFGTNPITGQSLEAKSLIKLNVHKNSEGEYHCPVLYKVFNNNSHIVAIRGTGNVFSYEAVEQLNLKAKNFKDLLTDDEFAKKDILTLQDPSDLEKFNLATFHHLKNNLKVEDEEEERARKDPKYHLNSMSRETEAILDELDREYKPKEKKPAEERQMADKFNAAHYSTGTVAAGFTSTIMEPTTKHEAAVMDEDIVRYARIKKKGYVRIHTNFGMLNAEIHCEMVPKTCENFLKHCLAGYYNNTKFHRSIRNFMLQGGDPLGTGKGGESIWGKPFKDEFKPNLVHAGRGILSMANAGPNTNQSQFFITYRSCRHLDNKHSVFGRIVGGLDTLNAIEKIEADAKDKPMQDVIVEKMVVFVDPYQEVDDQLVKDREEEVNRISEEKLAWKTRKPKGDSDRLTVFKQGIGKYINPSTSKQGEVDKPEPAKKKKAAPTSTQFDFSKW